MCTVNIMVFFLLLKLSSSLFRMCVRVRAYDEVMCFCIVYFINISVSCPKDLQMMSLMIFCYLFLFFSLFSRSYCRSKTRYVATRARIYRTGRINNPAIACSSTTGKQIRHATPTRIQINISQCVFLIERKIFQLAVLLLRTRLCTLLALLGMHSQPERKKNRARQTMFIVIFVVYFVFLYSFNRNKVKEGRACGMLLYTQQNTLRSKFLVHGYPLAHHYQCWRFSFVKWRIFFISIQTFFFSQILFRSAFLLFLMCAVGWEPPNIFDKEMSLSTHTHQW